MVWWIIFLETELQEDISGGNKNLFKKRSIILFYKRSQIESQMNGADDG